MNRTPEMLQPSAWLLKASSDMAHVIGRDAVAGTGHDPTTLDLLLRLRFAPEKSMRAVDLCEDLQKSPSHLSRVVDRAESGGLVRRMPDPDDRRAHLIAPTPAGEAAVEAYLPRLESVLLQTVYSALDDEEIGTLVGLLKKVSRAARAKSV